MPSGSGVGALITNGGTGKIIAGRRSTTGASKESSPQQSRMSQILRGFGRSDSAESPLYFFRSTKMGAAQAEAKSKSFNTEGHRGTQREEPMLRWMTVSSLTPPHAA